MKRFFLRMIGAALVLMMCFGVARAEKPTDERLRTVFARELGMVEADRVSGVAVVELKVTHVKQARYCPGRTARCGLNPTCGHPGIKVAVAGYSVVDTPIREGQVDVPETFADRMTGFGGPAMKLKENDTVWAAVIAYTNGRNNLTTPRKLGADAAAKDTIKLTGKVVFNDFEGGFYGIVADDGGKYDPTNLPAEFKKAGTRVSVVARKRPGMMSFHQWGTIVEIVEIK
ncbi:MAG TPA: hypothetical protein VMY42_17630 [Thermoguttaceae bacterium]|nr:hypothetical protein [Thermoguttaceae bacterium]